MTTPNESDTPWKKEYSPAGQYNPPEHRWLIRDSNGKSIIEVTSEKLADRIIRAVNAEEAHRELVDCAGAFLDNINDAAFSAAAIDSFQNLRNQIDVSRKVTR